MDAFLSYAVTDRPFARRLAGDLRERGISVWFDETDLGPGDSWVPAVQRAVIDAPAFIAVVPPSADSSPWFSTELATALAAGERQPKRIVPVVPDVDRELPPFLRQFHAVDLSGSQYEDGLQRLVSQLKVSAISGPLPPPELLQHYNDIVPGMAERIVRMVEVEALHRRRMEERTKIQQLLGPAFFAALLAVLGVLTSALSGKDLYAESVVFALGVGSGLLVERVLRHWRGKRDGGAPGPEVQSE